MLTDLDIPSRDDDERPSDRGSLVSSHQDPFDLLATEIVGDIFSYACPNFNFPARNLRKEQRLRDCKSDPAILSLVCKRWHAITTVNHSLWTSIIINAERINERNWTRWGFLQLQSRLESSGTYPLNIHIDDSKDAVILGILDIIIPHSERWRSIALTIFGGRELFQKLNTLIGRLPLLEHLEVKLHKSKHSEDNHECTAFLSAPRLKSLCINLPRYAVIHIPREIQIPRTQISKLTLRICDPNERDFQEMLGRISVSLTSLTFLETFKNVGWPRPMSRNIRLPQLRRLCLSQDCFAALGMLICPSLEELEIFNGNEHIITQFLDCSSCSLTHFKLCSLSNYEPNTYQAILKHSSLSTLRSISLAEITERGLDLLNFNSLQLFPSLETLHLYLRIPRHGSLRRLYPIKKIRKVIDSRACTASLDPLESILHGPQATEVHRVARSSLKECRFHFNLEIDDPVRDDCWNKEPISALKSFCISKKIRVSLKTSYWWRHPNHPTMRSDDGDLGIEWDLKFP